MRERAFSPYLMTVGRNGSWDKTFSPNVSDIILEPHRMSTYHNVSNSHKSEWRRALPALFLHAEYKSHSDLFPQLKLCIYFIWPSQNIVVFFNVHDSAWNKLQGLIVLCNEHTSKSKVTERLSPIHQIVRAATENKANFANKVVIWGSSY